MKGGQIHPPLPIFFLPNNSFFWGYGVEDGKIKKLGLEWRRGEQINHRLFFNSLLRKLNFPIPTVGFARPPPPYLMLLAMLILRVVEWEQDDYCDMPLTLGACNMRVGMGICSKISWSTSSRPQIFRRLGSVFLWTEMVTSASPVHAGNSRTVRTLDNEGALKAAVK